MKTRVFPLDVPNLRCKGVFQVKVVNVLSTGLYVRDRKRTQGGVVIRTPVSESGTFSGVCMDSYLVCWRQDDESINSEEPHTNKEIRELSEKRFKVRRKLKYRYLSTSSDYKGCWNRLLGHKVGFSVTTFRSVVTFYLLPPKFTQKYMSFFLLFLELESSSKQ